MSVMRVLLRICAKVVARHVTPCRHVVCVYLCVYMCICKFKWVCMCIIYTYIYIHTYIHTYMHNTHTRARAHTHTHTHTHTPYMCVTVYIIGKRGCSPRVGTQTESYVFTLREPTPVFSLLTLHTKPYTLIYLELA
jgi:hypothetical protein